MKSFSLVALMIFSNLVFAQQQGSPEYKIIHTLHLKAFKDQHAHQKKTAKVPEFNPEQIEYIVKENMRVSDAHSSMHEPQLAGCKIQTDRSKIHCDDGRVYSLVASPVVSAERRNVSGDNKTPSKTTTTKSVKDPKSAKQF